MENEKWQEDANEKRPQRPRFTRVERAYSANGSTGERAFRPQGFDVPSGNGEHRSGYVRQNNYGHSSGGQGSFNHPGGNLTIPYEVPRGTTLVLSVADKVEARKLVE